MLSTSLLVSSCTIPSGLSFVNCSKQKQTLKSLFHKIIFQSFVWLQTFALKQPRHRRGLLRKELGSREEYKQKRNGRGEWEGTQRGFLLEKKGVKMKEWRMVEEQERWLGCFIDTLLSASKIIYQLDRSPNNIHIHGYAHKLISTHTRSPPLSLWVFIFGKSTSLTMCDSLHTQASISLFKHTHKHADVICSKTVSQDNVRFMNNHIYCN